MTQASWSSLHDPVQKRKHGELFIQVKDHPTRNRTKLKSLYNMLIPMSPMASEHSKWRPYSKIE